MFAAIGKPFYWMFRGLIRAAFERAKEDELRAIKEELCPGQKELDEATAALADREPDEAPKRGRK
jgi:hypothetical protein